MQGFGETVGRLKLQRKKGQKLIISFKTTEGEDLVLAVITVAETNEKACRLLVNADRRIQVMRNELVGIPDADKGKL